MADENEHLLACRCLFAIHLVIGKVSVQIFSLSRNGFFDFILSFGSSLHILHTSPLLDIFCKYFLTVRDLPFHFLNGRF